MKLLQILILALLTISYSNSLSARGGNERNEQRRPAYEQHPAYGQHPGEVRAVQRGYQSGEAAGAGAAGGGGYYQAEPSNPSTGGLNPPPLPPPPPPQ